MDGAIVTALRRSVLLHTVPSELAGVVMKAPQFVPSELAGVVMKAPQFVPSVALNVVLLCFCSTVWL